jgi:hypothetical protein
MRRKRRNPTAQIEVSDEVPRDPVPFDDVLSRELDVPTVIELDADETVAAASSPTSSDGRASSPGSEPGRNGAAIDSTEDENALLRAELLATPSPPAHPPVNSGLAEVGDPAPSMILAATDQVSATTRLGPPVHGLEMPPLEPPREPEEVHRPGRGFIAFEQQNFWDRYEEATSSAELFAVPPAAITVVIGSLDVAVPVAERCQAGHWVSECDVFVLTEQEHIAGQPTWTTVRRPSDVVAVLEDGRSDFPLIVIDVPRELPAWIRPLVARLRDGGVGLVHYVLGSDPSDEDLATWHGELGRPAVLDLASAVPPDRVLQLLDRGEPLSSVAGMPISTELLLALRLNNA